MEKYMEDQMAYFTRLVSRLMGTSLLHLNRRLVPNEYPERTLVPPLVGQLWDEVLFGGLLFSCAQGCVYEIDTYLGICFSALQLHERDGFVVLGPYVPAESGHFSPEPELLKRRIPAMERENILSFYDQLPILSHDKLYAVLSMLEFELYGTTLAEAFEQQKVGEEDAPSCPIFSDDLLRVQAEVLVERYAKENEILDRVLRGEKIGDQLYGTIDLHRIRDPVRNAKNFLIILNSLLRKNLERAKIHPFYIDRISTRWALRIEEIKSMDAVDKTVREMLESYSSLVRRFSQANYTHHVRAAISYLQFHLAESDLSLKKLAKELGINASYLSHQFNQETGKHLTEYLAGMRVEEAKRLLRSYDTMTVSQVAAAVGYNDVNYFSRVFRRYTGKTPSEFRNERAGAPGAFTVK